MDWKRRKSASLPVLLRVSAGIFAFLTLLESCAAVYVRIQSESFAVGIVGGADGPSSVLASADLLSMGLPRFLFLLPPLCLALILFQLHRRGTA